MQILPKANPLKEHLPANRAVITNVLKKLGEDDFTGYMNLNAPGYDAFCIFALGNMVSVVSIGHSGHISGFDAFEQMLEKVFTIGGELNIYRMTPDLMMCAHALLHGAKLFSDEVIRQIDMKAIFADLKKRGLNGVVRFAADDRLAMIFFKGGNPLGFYSNGAQSIETSPDESRKIAAMPGAKLDVFSINPLEDIIPYDLLQMFNIDKIWEHIAENRAAAEAKPPQPEQPAADELPDQDEELSGLIEDLQDVATAYLSKSGGAIIEKQLLKAGGASILYDVNKTDLFLNSVHQDALLIDDEARIEEMIDLMRSEIAQRAHNIK